MRSPVSKEKKIEMQNLYDKMREEEGGDVRVVMYLPKKVYDKIEELSQEWGISGEEVLERLLDQLKT
jgi:aerotaxis receptor